jgi:hypothetical protein
MPNTTNYSFPTPADTDLVKNGADAIRDLGDAVDTAMNTALGTKKAMGVLLSTVSFSAVASQSVNDVFTATYANYLINLEFVQNTSNANIGFRYRVAGADNSTGNYFYMITGLNTTPAADNINAALQTTSLFTRNIATGRTGATMNFFNPQLAVSTMFNSISFGTSSGGQAASFTGAGLFNANTQFDGITFITSAGTMTGTIRVYGYNN